MCISRMIERFGPNPVFWSGVIILMLAPATYGQVKELDQAACRKAKGVWIKAKPTGVPGDGTSHVKIVATGPEGSEVLGGHAQGLRQKLDDSWAFTCPMNPPQPPTVENSNDRRCTKDGSDMSVEDCSISNSAVTCEYVNAKDAPAKLIDLGACFKTD